MSHPIIVTLGMDRRSQAFLDGLRAAHFPPERNWLAAHLTVYHALPAGAGEALLARARGLVPEAPVEGRLGGLVRLGRGVAAQVEAPGMAALRRALAAPWAAQLTAQDRAPWRPHVTVANKLPVAEARALHAALSAGWSGRPLQLTGLAFWLYLGPAWQALGEVPFAQGPCPLPSRDGGC